MNNHLKAEFNIQDLRQQNMTAAIEAIAVFIFAFFLIAFIPQAIFNTLLSMGIELQDTTILAMMPQAGLFISVMYFLYAIIGNLVRSFMIHREFQVIKNCTDFCCSDDGTGCEDCGCENCDDCSCDMGHAHHDHHDHSMEVAPENELAQLEALAAEVLAKQHTPQPKADKNKKAKKTKTTKA
jgi:hypothetical protein